MTPLDFLAVVLPSPGHGLYCAAELDNRRHVFAESIEDLEPHVKRWDAQNRNIFFALATFSDAAAQAAQESDGYKGRTAENAQYVRALFLDLDGYDSKKAAAETLDAFLARTELVQFGSPWIVSSGGGLHAYWPLDADATIAQWKPVAEAFKALCKQEGMRIDFSVTADSARVLRFPGTRNHKPKYPVARPVQLLHHGDTFSLQSLAAHISTKLIVKPVAATLALPGVRPTRTDEAAKVALLANTQTFFEPIWTRSSNGTGCAQLKAYMDNPQEDGLEPLWRGLLSWTKVCEDGEEYARRISALHPYSDERMRTKLREIKGPYPCAKMDTENPGVCPGCPHWGKVVNPLKLGRQLLTDNEERMVPLALPSPPAPPVPPPPVDTAEEFDFSGDDDEGDAMVHEGLAATVLRPKPPWPFSFGANGGVYLHKEEKGPDGEKIAHDVQLLPYDLFVVDVLQQEADCCVHVVAQRPTGAQSFVMPQRAIASPDDTVKFLASQNIIASFGKGNDVNLYNYLRACVSEASLRKPVDVPLQCGWQKDGSFVYNFRVFSPNGTERTFPMPGLENINRNTASSGTLENWRRVWDVFVRKRMYTLLALCADSFGSALMQFTPCEAFVWHIGSRDSGTGKSLTLSAKAGVWGHPIRYRTGSKTSPVAMQQRAGLLNSLPLLIDEITSTQRANMEWAPAFIFDLTEGQGKERMEAGANKERINRSNWFLTCTMTANTSLADYMSGARQHSSQGELLRMLEWNPSEKVTWTSEERRIMPLLKTNYGVAGEKWVRWLVQNRQTAISVVQQVYEKLQVSFSFTDDERYWHAGCTAAVAAAIMLKPGYADIIDLPVKKIVDALQELVNQGRETLKRSTISAEDVLNQFTRDNYGSFIVIRKAEGKLLAAWGDGETVDRSLTRTKVMGRVEHGLGFPGAVDYFIEEQLLKKHCVALSFGYEDFKRQLANRMHVTVIKKDMLSRTNGPSMRVSALHIRRSEAEHEDAVSVEPPAE